MSANQVSHHKEVQQVRRAAEDAGKILMKYYKNHGKIDFKKGDDPVTRADREADTLLREFLLSEFPDTGWLSEETADSPDRLKKNRIWVVDPLDGTRDFLEGNGEFAISIALVEDGQPVVGVIYNPALERFWWGAAGNGACEGNKRCQCPARPPAGVAKALVSRSDSKKGWFAPFAEKFSIIPRGSVAYKLACLASGDADLIFTVTPRSEWDICAGVLLAREAGYRVTDVLGNELAFNRENVRVPGVIASHPACHSDILELLKKHNRL